MSESHYKKLYEDLHAIYSEHVQAIYDRQQREAEERLDDYMIVMKDGTIHEEVTDLNEKLQDLSKEDIAAIHYRWITPFKQVTLTKE